MVKGRFISSLAALGTLFLFTHTQLALADDVAWMAAHQTDGSCANNNPSRGGGHGCGGFLGWDCWGPPAIHFLGTPEVGGLLDGLSALLVGTALLLGTAAAAGLLVVGAPVFVVLAGALFVVAGLDLVSAGSQFSRLFR